MKRRDNEGKEIEEVEEKVEEEKLLICEIEHHLNHSKY